jgi:hypothetical protein
MFRTQFGRFGVVLGSAVGHLRSERRHPGVLAFALLLTVGWVQPAQAQCDPCTPPEYPAAPCVDYAECSPCGDGSCECDAAIGDPLEGAISDGYTPPSLYAICPGPTGGPMGACVGGVLHLCGSGIDRDECRECPTPGTAAIGDGFSYTWRTVGGSVCKLNIPDHPADCEANYRILSKEPFTVELTMNDHGCAGAGADDGEITCSFDVVPHCCGPYGINVGGLCPDGESTTVAQTDHVREIVWSFVGDSLGCTFEGCGPCWPPSAACLGVEYPITQGIKIRAGKRKGTLTIRAKDKIYGDCYVDQTLQIGCGGCSTGSCAPGTASAKTGHSLEISFPLGKTTRGESAGTLQIHADHASAALSTPLALSVSGTAADTQVTRTEFYHPDGIGDPLPKGSYISSIAAPEGAIVKCR